MVKQESVKRFSDQRGFVFEPLKGEELAIQKNAHVVVSRPGAVRGNHYHLKGTETLVICGQALVRIRKDDAIEDFTAETDCLLIAFNTEPHDPNHPELVQEILIPF